jgi:hypothetical protein
MKHYKLSFLALLSVVFLFQSCIEHEVIPAPTPMVDLSCHFIGTINGTNLELTENVNYYTGNATKNLNILPPPTLSSAAYNFEMSSATQMNSIKVVLGSALWDASISATPDVNAFNAFHATTTTPLYSTFGGTGFEVSYKDGNGMSWTSKQNSVNPQDVQFTGILQESDAAGDYSKFVCSFNCYVYRQDPVTLLWDSIYIQNGELRGWFQR